MFRIRPLFGLLVLSVFYSLVAADKNNSDGIDGDQASQTSSASASVSTPSAAAGNGTSGSQGDKQCLSQLMCITGTVSGSTVTYELQSITSQSLGWMAVGFGSQMANTPMVIMWPNSDGTMTLSQRQASGHVMPTPVASPTNTATASTPLSTLSGSQPVLAFTIAGSASQVPLIWAFGTTRPSAAADSTLAVHITSGTLTLDLTKTLSANGTPSSSSSSSDLPLLPYEKVIVAHAVVATFAFLFLLPAGVLLARYTRTISSKWYTGHWVIQAALAGPAVVTGIILGFMANSQAGVSITTDHQNAGIALLVLYFVQCFLGAFIHFVKIPSRFKRPPQNYGHAILGLTILALALYQVRLGYQQEWPNTTGRPPLSNTINIVWIVWTVLLSVLYFGGLAYLPRQWRQENGNANTFEYQMGTTEDSQEDKLNERFS